MTVYPTYNGQPVTPAPISVNLGLNILPAGTGITAQVTDTWYGPFTVQEVLEIVIAPSVATGTYTFEISVEVNGQEWGALPCNIYVS